MKANLCFTAFCVVFTVLSCFSFSTATSDSNILTNSIKKFQPNLNSSFRENDVFCLGQFDIRDFQITPFEAIYVDTTINPHIRYNNTEDQPDEPFVNEFFFSEVEPWHLGLQNASLGSKARSNYQYHSYRRAKHSIVVGNLVTPTTDLGDYIVEANGKLTLKAGDEIVLKSGVHFKVGSTVHIKAEYEACHDFKSGGKDSSSTSNPKTRFFLDVSAYGAWDGKINDIKSGVFGVQMKFGNDFMLKPIHENLYVRLNWLRLGLILGDASGLILTPLHAGVGYQLKLTKNLTLEPKITGGLYLGTDDIFYPSFEYDFGVVPALSIVSKKNFSIEVEWVRRRNFLGHYSGSYLNLSIGSIIF